MFGAVEIKYMSKRPVKDTKKGMFQLNYKSQIEAHIRYFKKVIYTNGLTWQFYLFDDSRPNGDTRDIERDELIEEFVLGTMEGGEISWKADAEKVWEDLLGYLYEIDWKTPGKLEK